MSVAVAIVILGCQVCATWVFTVWMRIDAERRHRRDEQEAWEKAGKNLIQFRQQSRGGN